MRVVYLDVNGISLLADHPETWASFRSWLQAEDSWLALTDAHLAELHDADRKHKQIAKFLATTPGFLGMSGEQLLAAEVRSYPAEPTEPFVWHALSELPDAEAALLNYLSSGALADGRTEMRENAARMEGILDERQPRFPPSATGVYTANQAPLFVHHVVIQRLANAAPQFLLEQRSDSVRVERFRSLLAGPAIAFYKYYLGRRKPREPSDLGDQLHLQYFLYSDVVVTENDIAELLRQAGAQIPVLRAIDVRTLDFLKGFARSSRAS